MSIDKAKVVAHLESEIKKYEADPEAVELKKKQTAGMSDDEKKAHSMREGGTFHKMSQEMGFDSIKEMGDAWKKSDLENDPDVKALFGKMKQIFGAEDKGSK